MKQCGVYIRISKGSRTSLETQKDILMGYADLRGWSVKKVFSDSSSGVNSDRPAYKELLKAARQRTIDIVLVTRLDRFGRSLSELTRRIKEFEELGVEFVSYSEGMDTTTSAGKLLFSVIGAFAEYEHNLIREKTIEGIRKAKRDGKKLGRPEIQVNGWDIKAARARGWTWKKICKEFNCSENTARRREREDTQRKRKNNKQKL